MIDFLEIKLCFKCLRSEINNKYTCMVNFFEMMAPIFKVNMRGIRGYKLMYIPKKETQNYPFRRLKLVVETF